jgi:hypothetical protein
MLSWYVRPLFLLPFCWFAYRRSWRGLGVTVIALITSMAWFPAPEHPSPQAVQMLRTEREYLLGDWTGWRVAIALLVPLTFAGLVAALWRRSVGWGLVVINAAILFKIAWTFWFADLGAALAHLVPAAGGLAAVDAVVLGSARWIAHRRGTAQQPSSPPQPVATSPELQP